jgi:hypothetical protein
MRKVKLSMQMTINGYVTGLNGENDWMTWNPDDEFMRFSILILIPQTLFYLAENWEKVSLNIGRMPWTRILIPHLQKK